MISASSALPAALVLELGGYFELVLGGVHHRMPLVVVLGIAEGLSRLQLADGIASASCSI